MTSKPILLSRIKRKCSSSYIVKNVKKIVGTLASYRMLELLLHGKPYTHQIHFSTLLPYRIKQIHIIQHLYIFTYQINACCPLWQTNRIPISPAMNKIQHIIYQHTFSHFHKVLQQIHIIQHTHTHTHIYIFTYQINTLYPMTISENSKSKNNNITKGAYICIREFFPKQGTIISTFMYLLVLHSKSTQNLFAS